MTDDIAIVGFSFKGPQEAHNEAGLWKVLEKRENLMTEWPKSRVNLDSFYDGSEVNFNKLKSRGGHFIRDDPSVFDAPFFSITAKEAASMDPQHRMTLESSFRAFENAGMPVDVIKGSQTAVFAASMSDDYSRMYIKDPESIARGTYTGNALALLANRVSWHFDLRGPSVHLDTACSGGMMALDMACQSLRSGSASMALAIGANLMLGPEGSIMLHNGNYLSPDGVSYSFDHRANGYSRGEGIVCVLVKPLIDAVRDGDMIRAVIRGTLSNQDGRTPIMTQPSTDAQERLIRETYRQAGLGLELTRFVEAHGTGTPVGDPAEMRAIGRVFRTQRSATEPLYVGSIKSNIGHLEGGAGLAGVVKAVLTLEKGIIPPNALFESMNPEIDSEFFNVRVPTDCIPWPHNGVRRVSVNSFGFGGSNSHVILDDAYHYLQDRNINGNHCTVPFAPATDKSRDSTTGHTDHAGRNGLNGTLEISPSREAMNGTLHSRESGKTGKKLGGATDESGDTFRLLVWTAADEGTLRSLAQSYETHLRTGHSHSPLNLDQMAYTLAARRSMMLWRTFAVIDSNAAGAFGTEEAKLLTAIPTCALTDPSLAFVFTGQGAQYVQMGLSLIQYSVFRDTLQQIDEVIRNLGIGWSVFDELLSAEDIDRPEYSQPLCTALQIALIELLKSFGVVPSAVLGHSSGEIAAAYATGALSLESACKVAYWRGYLAGRLRKTTKTPGAMLSANLSANEADGYLTSIRGAAPELIEQVRVACINSPSNVTLSGPEDAIDLVLEQLETDGIFGRRIKTGVAYHTSAMNAIAAEYQELIGSIEAGDYDPFSAVPMVSSVTGKAVDSPGVLATAQYWTENLVSPVKFSEALTTIVQGGLTVVSPVTHLIEIGPHPALRRPIQETLGELGKAARQLRYGNALHKSKPACQAVLELFGQLFCAGYPVSVTKVNQDLSDNHNQCQPFYTDLPAYPFDHSRSYWSEPRLSRDYRLRPEVPRDSLGARFPDWNPLEPKWRRFLSCQSTPWTRDHIVLGNAIYPGTGLLVMAMEAAKQICPDNRQLAGYFFKEANFLAPIVVGETDDDGTETIIQLRRIQSLYEKDTVWAEVNITTQSHDRWTECFRATLQLQYEDERTTEVDGGLEQRLWDARLRSDFSQATEVCTKRLSSSSFFKYCYQAGLRYGKCFQVLDEIRWNGDELAIAKIDVSREEHQAVSLTHPAVLDSAIQVLLAQHTKGLTEPPPTLVPSRMFNAWFAASGWQPPQASAVHVLTTCDSVANGRSLGASISVLSDKNTPLCSIENIVLAPVSERHAEQSHGTVMLHRVEWAQQISLMSPDELRLACHADLFTEDESNMAVFRKTLEPILEKVIRKVLSELSNTERKQLPAHLAKHIAWMERYADCHADSGSTEDFSDDSLDKMLDEVEALLPSWKIFPAVARDLKAILMGEKDALQIAFGTGLAEMFYGDVFNNICDTRFRSLLELVSHENPNLEILEVGAGTGGMTRHILDVLGDLERQTGGTRFSEYTYTDISASFFETAREQLKENKDRMTFKVLDLDRSAQSQGFKEASYDVVFAGCVLHATTDLNKTMSNLRALLKPGGRLIMLEVTAPENVTTNFAFGVLPGWWSSYGDHRRHYPTMEEQQWDQLLRQEKFSGNDLVLRDYKDDSCHSFSLIVSTLCGQLKTNGVSKSPSRVAFIIRSPSDECAMEFCEMLRERGPEGEARVICLDDEPEPEIGEDDMLISLLEVSAPYLSTVSESEYQTVQKLILRARKLLWVTSTCLDDVKYHQYAVAQGFLRSIRSENPDKHIVSISSESASQLDRSATYTLAQQVIKVWKAAFESGSDELEYCVRDGRLLTARLAEDAAENKKLHALVAPSLREEAWEAGPPVKLTVGSIGFLDTLEFIDDKAAYEDLGPFEIEIETRAWGLNFRDIFVALGRLPGEDPGADCAGTVRRIGSRCEEITELRPGARVCGIVGGCMRTFARAHASNFVQIPESLSFDMAASIITPGVTAYHSLIDVARLRKGEKVLIHSGSGATGQMAIRIAKMVGAEIFATVGFDGKKQLLIDQFGIPADHIFFSRNTTFARGVMRMTEGYGVDVVLNSLSGDLLRASWDCMAPNGRFIEIGKADITANSTLPMSKFALNVSFSAVDLHPLMSSHPTFAAELLQKLLNMLTTGTIQSPRPLHIYSATEVEQAFRFLQSGKNTGRIIIHPDKADIVRKRILERKTWRLDPDASYVIVGASGGLGRAIAMWMAGRGAKHLILLSRSGATSPAAQKNVTELHELGVNVAAPKCDVSDEESVGLALQDCARTMPAVKGCINSAMALNDTVFGNMTHSQWQETIRSKVNTSWNLHKLLPQGLDFFVLLSSLSGIYGSIAQSNYAGGCASQDALARYRVAHGEKAVSFDLGWIRNIGIVAETELYQQNRQTSADMMPIEDTELMALLDIYCDPSHDMGADLSLSQLLVGAVTPADCLRRGLDPPTLSLRPMFSRFSRVLGEGQQQDSDGRNKVDFAALFCRAETVEERAAIVILGLSTKLARAMSIEVDDVQPSRQLSDYGVDSLMAVELRNWFSKEFGANVAVFEIMGTSTITSIGRLVVEKSDVGEVKEA